MQKLKLAICSLIIIGTSSTAYANVCNMWGTARQNTKMEEFNLETLKKYASKSEFTNVRNCYGTDQLTSKVTLSPFDIPPFSGPLDIEISSIGEQALGTFKTSGETFKLKVNGERSQILGSDNKWHDVVNNLGKIKQAVDVMIRHGANPATVSNAKRESDIYLEPMKDGMWLTGLGTAGSMFGLFFSLQFAPLADSTGVRESIGGWDTTLWEVNNKKAEAYAASRGRMIDLSGSYIRYWISNRGLVIKIDARIDQKLTGNSEPAIYKYRVERSIAPDPLWVE